MTKITLFVFALFNIFVYISTVFASLFNLRFYIKRSKGTNANQRRLLYFCSFLPFINLGILIFTLIKVRNIYDATYNELVTLTKIKEEKENEIR